jgi:hypothetical protein
MPLASEDLSQQDCRLLEATLQRAAKLLRKKRWSKGAPARDAAGAEVDPADPRATAFCIAGAFMRAGTCLDTATVRKGMALLHRAAREMAGDDAADLFDLNDNPQTAKKDAVAVLARAACLAAREEAGFLAAGAAATPVGPRPYLAAGADRQ